ncbi:MAG: Glucose-6-phosphate isomerase [Candidatus Carbobacillus altaicus]|uniref:Glucose-6-phosphate isomerase n=1 Tax=Candidatus Carbonibacillus altaicus TaxID=2163959 RepID=A0A2R6Y4B3_9BACL|nr:MAG: Glucose-6-phosphate isomerase [Candidatus Carbobacillus altaicus]
MPITYDGKTLSPYIEDVEYDRLLPAVRIFHEQIVHKARDAKYLGWLDVVEARDVLLEVRKVAEMLQKTVDVLVVIGIGGSYLGARAALEALSPELKHTSNVPAIEFIGHHMSAWELNGLMQRLKGRHFAINVISKSGTTTEPAIAFRLLKDLLIAEVGEEEAKRRIIATTDPKQGALRAMADKEGYTSFAIPPEVGGRFSVLTPVGLLPLATAGIDIEALIDGARVMKAHFFDEKEDLLERYRYALSRTVLYQKGYDVELFSCFEPRLAGVGDWLVQLFAESEGKNRRGILPVRTQYTTDLHSLGQYIQEGRRMLFETMLWIEEADAHITVPPAKVDLDGLGYLEGMSLHWIQEQAMHGVMLAHSDGGVPVSRLVLPKLDAYHMGALLMFFELSVAMSGQLLGIHPFNQPGVEAYKQNMFALLGKPGYEAKREELRRRLRSFVNEGSEREGSE